MPWNPSDAKQGKGKEMPDDLREWFEELDRRWRSGEELSPDDAHRLCYLRSTYINEIRAEAMARCSDRGKIVYRALVQGGNKAMARCSDGRVTVK